MYQWLWLWWWLQECRSLPHLEGSLCESLPLSALCHVQVSCLCRPFEELQCQSQMTHPHGRPLKRQLLIPTALCFTVNLSPKVLLPNLWSYSQMRSLLKCSCLNLQIFNFTNVGVVTVRSSTTDYSTEAVQLLYRHLNVVSCTWTGITGRGKRERAGYRLVWIGKDLSVWLVTLQSKSIGPPTAVLFLWVMLFCLMTVRSGDPGKAHGAEIYRCNYMCGQAGSSHDTVESCYYELYYQVKVLKILLASLPREENNKICYRQIVLKILFRTNEQWTSEQWTQKSLKCLKLLLCLVQVLVLTDK